MRFKVQLLRLNFFTGWNLSYNNPKKMQNQDFLIKMVQVKMPFGQYKGWYITALPVHYLEWFNRKGFPDGTLGQYLSTMFEIKTNGLEEILEPIIKANRFNQNRF
jgi:uncharacterized protein